MDSNTISFPPVKRIVVIGDIHGDMNSLKKILRETKIIDDNNKWIGENTYVVQLGDIIDSCRPTSVLRCCDIVSPNDSADDFKIIDFMIDLKRQGIKDGGNVICLMGNHELINIDGNFNYVSKKNLKGRERIKCGGEYAKKIADNFHSICFIGSNCFVHGGIVDSIIETHKISTRNDFKKLDSAIKMWIRGEISKDSVIESILYKPNSSWFWNRTLGKVNMLNAYESCKQISKTVKVLNLSNIFVGHTVVSEGIDNVCSKVWRTDCAISRPAFAYYNRKIEVVEIIDDNKIKVVKI